MATVPARSTAYLRGDDLARFESRITKALDGCWIFDQPGNGGYALFFTKGKKRSAHRWSYEWFIGPIPAGLVIDHTCKQRSCVNPDHLEAVTQAENNRRRRNNPDECHRGHDLSDPANVYMRGRIRHCKPCRRINAAERRKRLQEDPNREPRTPRTWDSGKCQRGHDVTDPENVYTYKGERSCKPCRQEAYQRYEAANPQRKNRKRKSRRR